MFAGPSTPIERWRAVAMLSFVALAASVYLTFRNTGISATVFADEYIYSLFSRLLPPSTSIFPSFLFLHLFSVTTVCGDGFLECGRALNVALLVASLPFLYATCRTVASQGVSIFVAALTIFGPANIYTAYYMPETTYFLLFQVFTWFVLVVAPRRDWLFGLGAGALMGLLALVKMHGLFLLGGLGLFMLSAWAWRARPFRLGAAVGGAVGLAVGLVTVRFGGGYLLAGEAGAQLLGSVYGSVATGMQQGSMADTLVQANGVLTGHVLALALLFGVPFALLLVPRLGAATTPAPVGSARPPADPLRTLERFLASNLVVLVVIAVVFTASISGVGPYETIDRVHMRYYAFLLPLFAMVAAGHFSRRSSAQSAATSTPQRLVFGAVAVVVVLALLDDLHGFAPSLADCPDLRGATRETPTFITVAMLSTLSLALCAWRPALGLAVYFLGAAPTMVVLEQASMAVEVREVGVPIVCESAGRFTRDLLGPRAGEQVLVVGSDPAALFRTQFALDNPQTRTVLAATDAPFDRAQVPADVRFVLFIDAYPDMGTPFAPTQALGFTLVQVR